MRSVEDVVSPLLKDMRRSGEGFRSTCPLCNHARTFLISNVTGMFVCFNSRCSQKGGLSKLLYLIGLSSQEVSAQMEGVRLEDPPTVFDRVRSIQDSKILPEYILGAYAFVPNSLLRAGFTEQILAEHQVGYDHRSSRITFPIRDHIGRLVAVTGRADPHGYPRYLVYEDEYRSIFPGYRADNRRHLYGIDTVYAAKYINSSDCSPIIIVEGYKACLWLRQHGYKNTVALQGDSMTPTQELMLKRMRGEKIVLLDNEPGKQLSVPRKGCRAFSIARRLRVADRVRIGTYPTGTKGYSPDDLGEAGLEFAISNAKTLLERRLSDGIL
tara:strand:- start:783 stop:1760 length:978 start_codon:yes stop_codon:yes gene_type:complete